MAKTSIKLLLQRTTTVSFLVFIINSATAADSPRLALWVTETITLSSKIECQSLSDALINLPITQPVLTERDVHRWNVTTGQWTLDPTRYNRDTTVPQLQDHCFVLAIDGKRISSGVILSARSARLTELPVLRVTTHHGMVTLQLTVKEHNAAETLIHRQLLDEVLANSGNHDK